MKTPGRRRTLTLTQQEWEAVNTALTEPEAGGYEAQTEGMSEDEADRFLRAIEHARAEIGAICRPRRAT